MPPIGPYCGFMKLLKDFVGASQRKGAPSDEIRGECQTNYYGLTTELIRGKHELASRSAIGNAR